MSHFISGLKPGKRVFDMVHDHYLLVLGTVLGNDMEEVCFRDTYDNSRLWIEFRYVTPDRFLLM